MAKIYPAKIEGIVKSERRVLKQLSRLSDDWYVFHSISWQGLRKGRQGDGEADFVILNPKFGIAVLEVKGGEVDIKSGTWVSTNYEGTHTIKNPFEQAKNSKYTLVKFLESLTSTSRSIPICHGVVLPDISYFEGIGLYGSRELVCDSQGLLKMEEYLASLFNYWGSNSTISLSDLNLIVGKLSPSLLLRRRLVDRINNAEADIIHFTEEQILAMSALRYIPRALVKGTAGTGKTVLAEALIMWYQENEHLNKVLYVCYNELLAKKLNAMYGGTHGIECKTYQGLAIELIRKAGLKLPEKHDWDMQLTGLFVQALNTNNPNYAAILIDEAQDFDADWLYALWIMAEANHGRIIVFGDSHQKLYKRDWTLPENIPEFPLTKNCRNTKNIARKVERSIGVTNPNIVGPDGPQPVFLEAETKRDQIETVLSIAESLVVEENIAPNRLVMLCDSPDMVRILRENGPGGYPITDYGKNGILAETVRRFKGLDAEIIIACLSNIDSFQDDEVQRLAYVALSRAKSMLYIVAPKKLKKLINW